MRRHEASLNVKLISIAISYYIYYSTFHGPLRIHYSQIGIYKLIVVGKGRLILIVNKSVVNALYFAKERRRVHPSGRECSPLGNTHTQC